MTTFLFKTIIVGLLSVFGEETARKWVYPKVKALGKAYKNIFIEALREWKKHGGRRRRKR